MSRTTSELAQGAHFACLVSNHFSVLASNAGHTGSLACCRLVHALRAMGAYLSIRVGVLALSTVGASDSSSG